MKAGDLAIELIADLFQEYHRSYFTNGPEK